MFKRLFGFILIIIMLLSSCIEEHTMSDSVRRLNITFADELTRSSWNDNTDTEGGNVNYIWDNDNNKMKNIKNDGQYVPFYESMPSAATYHSMTDFEKKKKKKSKIKLQTMSGVKYDVTDGEYVYPVAANDNMYCCHPINDKTTVTSSSAAVTVDMSLPSTFTFDKLSNDLSTLKDYSYV